MLLQCSLPDYRAIALETGALYSEWECEGTLGVHHGVGGSHGMITLQHDDHPQPTPLPPFTPPHEPLYHFPTT